MINIWEFAEDLPFVEIKDINGAVFAGGMIHVSDSEEADAEEDAVIIKIPNGGIRVFPVSQIASIKRINRYLL